MIKAINTFPFKSLALLLGFFLLLVSKGYAEQANLLIVDYKKSEGSYTFSFIGNYDFKQRIEIKELENRIATIINRSSGLISSKYAISMLPELATLIDDVKEALKGDENYLALKNIQMNAEALYEYLDFITSPDAYVIANGNLEIAQNLLHPDIQEYFIGKYCARIMKITLSDGFCFLVKNESTVNHKMKFTYGTKDSFMGSMELTATVNYCRSIYNSTKDKHKYNFVFRSIKCL